MERKTITVTEQQDFWIKDQVASGNYGNDSEYLRDLIRKDQAYKNKVEALRVALIEGEESGVSKHKLPDILAKVKKKHNITEQ